MLFKHHKEIYDLLAKLEIDDFMWVAKWIQTLFVLNFKFELVIKFWDIFISNGIDSILVLICGILDFFQDRILASVSIEDFLGRLDLIYNMDGYEYSNLINHLLNLIKNKNYL